MTEQVRVKRIHDPASPEDGQRVLVDRIWPRGTSKQAASLTLWLRDVAPTTELRQWFGHDISRWEEFRRRYREELLGNAAVALLEDLIDKGAVTLLYGAHDHLHNNAVVLADFLRNR